MIKSAIGTEYTISTNQLDFLATQTFDLTYIGEDGADHPVYVIHRAPLGTHERFTAFLIEHYAGAFPTWLAPIQARVIPISDKVSDYAHKVRGRAVRRAGGQRHRRAPGGHRHLQRADAEEDPRRPVAENPLYAGGGRAGGRRAARSRSGFVPARIWAPMPLESVHRPASNWKRNPARMWRNSPSRKPGYTLSYGQIRLAAGCERQPGRVRRKAPVCVHDRTSFRLAPTEPAKRVTHGLLKEKSHSSQTFSAKRARASQGRPAHQ